MTTSLRQSRAPAAPVAGREGLPWFPAVAAGLAVLLAGTPVSAVVQGTAWLDGPVLVVAAVVATGLLLYRRGAAVVAVGQCAASLLVLTALFADDAVFGLLPGPAALRQFTVLSAGAAAQIDVGTAPVAATPEIQFLVTVAFGLLAVAVHLAAVSAGAPAAAGVPLLAVFAVPAALADELLPWWTVAAAAIGFGLLLVAGGGARRQVLGSSAVVAGAVAVALLVGTLVGFVGTAGRFEGGRAAGGGNAIGLSPFTSLRGKLEETAPEELFRVRGLSQASYLRALTLREYVPGAGWQFTNPGPGERLPGSLPPAPGSEGDVVDVQIENVGFRDYWLPLYGAPLEIDGVTESQWFYDAASGTGYTPRPRQEDGWQQRTVLPAPTVATLRAADGTTGVGPEYLSVAGVDDRVIELSKEVVAGAETSFDQALALQDYFTGRDNQFVYSLQTAAPGGDDALVEFLTVGRTGYCEQFASAMAVMLRAVGVPSRVAVGFTAGTDSGEYRSISTSDAHAWVEAWFPDVGWTAFDPTPLTDGRTIVPPYVLEARLEAAGGRGIPSPNELGLDEGRDQQERDPLDSGPLEPTPAAPTATGDGGLPLWPLVPIGLAVGAGLLPAALRLRDRRRRLAAVHAGGPGGADAGWTEVLAESTDRGVPPKPSDTVRATARRLVRQHRLDEPSQQALREIVGAVESSWYDDGTATGDGTSGVDLESSVRTVRRAITSGSAISVRERLLPRSVLDRARLRIRPANPGNDAAVRN